jgi:hypothetical protein
VSTRVRMTMSEQQCHLPLLFPFWCLDAKEGEVSIFI